VDVATRYGGAEWLVGWVWPVNGIPGFPSIHHFHLLYLNLGSLLIARFCLNLCSTAYARIVP
jgi:hypothetical protein